MIERAREIGARAAARAAERVEARLREDGHRVVREGDDLVVTGRGLRWIGGLAK